MVEILRANLGAIVAALLALFAGGLIIRFLRVRAGRDSNIVNQKGATAGGDIVGRDKVSTRKKSS